MTTKELADAVHLTPTPVFERQKRLEKKGYIKKYVAILDPEKLGQGLQVYCKVKLKQINHEIADAFVRRIQRIPEVTECYNTSGAYDYLLKVRARDMKQYQEFILNKLGEIENLSSIESTFVMSEVKQTYGLSLLIEDLRGINYFLHIFLMELYTQFCYFLYLCNRFRFTKTGNFLEIEKQKVVQKGKLYREERDHN